MRHVMNRTKTGNTGTKSDRNHCPEDTRDRDGDMDLIDMIGKPATLEQLAEECSELSQAALKLARKYRGENPTPKPEALCRKALTEEIADVMTCIEQLDKMVDWNEVDYIRHRKTARWMDRVMGGAEE